MQPKNTPESSTGVGLENINQRYAHLLNKKVEVTSSNAIFVIKLPIIHEYYNH